MLMLQSKSNYQQLKLLEIRRRICWKQKVQEATKVLFVESIVQFVLWNVADHQQFSPPDLCNSTETIECLIIILFEVKRQH